MSSSFGQLHPQLQAAAAALYNVAMQYGLFPTVTSVLRTYAQQARLYRRYLAGSSPYPAAPPGHSKHERGLAFDMVVQQGGFSPQQAWLGQVWESWGGRWGGRFKDPIHFEAP